MDAGKKSHLNFENLHLFESSSGDYRDFLYPIIPECLSRGGQCDSLSERSRHGGLDQLGISNICGLLT